MSGRHANKPILMYTMYSNFTGFADTFLRAFLVGRTDTDLLRSAHVRDGVVGWVVGGSVGGLPGEGG